VELRQIWVATKQKGGIKKEVAIKECGKELRLKWPLNTGKELR
jgi:hypothetical protein